MSFFSRLFRNKHSAPSKNESPFEQTRNPKITKILDLNDFVQQLLSSDSYIAKSDYLKKLDSSKETIQYFQQLKKDNLFFDFCKKNSISSVELLSVIQKCSDINNLVSVHNENYIAQKLKIEKKYLDTILHSIDPNIMLDDDQRRVVLTDEDYCLVIAGAGAGKTTTVAAKVKYLVEKKNVDPRKILVVSLQIKLLVNYKKKSTSNYKSIVLLQHSIRQGMPFFIRIIRIN